MSDKIIFLDEFDFTEAAMFSKIKTMKIEKYDKMGFIFKIINLYRVFPISFTMDTNEITISFDYFESIFC